MSRVLFRKRKSFNCEKNHYLIPKTLNAPILTAPIMIPDKITPAMHAVTLDLKSMSRILAAKVPVHAPVPGKGIPTKKKLSRK